MPVTGNPNDGDADGYPLDVDCDDADASVHPDAAELTCDGKDNDCADGDDRTDCALSRDEAVAIPAGDTIGIWFGLAGELDGKPGADIVSEPLSNVPGWLIGDLAGGGTIAGLGGSPAYTAGDADGDGRDDLWVRYSDRSTAWLIPGPITGDVDPTRDAIAEITDLPYYGDWQALGHLDVDADG